ncbi:hypothetical protein AYK24_03260 [Thermoplasmatales archaeon SG8-52-4]|nr:MAG: hypothetical protein AYK24_03260 [Thermoplasmatales archaeon SG8-52-4]
MININFPKIKYIIAINKDEMTAIFFHSLKFSREFERWGKKEVVKIRKKGIPISMTFCAAEYNPTELAGANIPNKKVELLLYNWGSN